MKIWVLATLIDPNIPNETVDFRVDPKARVILYFKCKELGKFNVSMGSSTLAALLTLWQGKFSPGDEIDTRLFLGEEILIELDGMELKTIKLPEKSSVIKN